MNATLSRRHHALARRSAPPLLRYRQGDERRIAEYWKLEPLEPRVMLSVTVVPVAPSGSTAWEVLADSSGNVYLDGQASNILQQVTPNGRSTLFNIPPVKDQLIEMAQTPDGSIWFEELSINQIGRLASGKITEYAIPSGNMPDSIAAGPNGDLYFTASGYTTPPAGSTQSGYSGSYGFITPQGRVSEIALPDNLAPYFCDSLVAVGSAMWFPAQDQSGNDLLIKVASGGALTEIPLGSAENIDAMNVATDGSLWLGTDNGIWHVSGDGVVSQYPAPDYDLGDLAPAADGGMWFGVDDGTNFIGHIAPGGAVTELYDSLGIGDPMAIGPGANGTLWLVNAGGTEAYQIDPTDPGFAGSPAPLVVSSGTPGAPNIVATFTDPNETGTASDYTAAMTFGDGITAMGMVQDNPGGGYAVSFAAAWPADATSVTVDITGSDGATGSCISHRLAPLIVKADQPIIYFDQFATFTDPNVDSGSLASDYTASITFSDGSTAAVTVGPSFNGYAVQSTTVWPLDATYADVSIVGTDGATGSCRSYPGISYEGGSVLYPPMSQFIASDSRADVWYASDASASIGYVTPQGSQTNFALPAGAIPAGLVLGPDGNIWFTDSANDEVGYITAAGQITEFSVASLGSPGDITTGPDGNLWFIVTGGAPGGLSEQGVASITPAGATSFYGIWPALGLDPDTIAVSADGTVWFAAETYALSFGAFRLTPGGGPSTIQPVTSMPTDEGVGSLALSNDGSVWFTTGGATTNLTAPGGPTTIEVDTSDTPLQYFTGAADGSFWLSGDDGNDLFHVLPDGAVGRYVIPDTTPLPMGYAFPPVTPVGAVLAVGDMLWYMTNGDNAIHSLDLSNSLLWTNTMPTELSGAPAAVDLAEFNIPDGAVDPAQYTAVITWPDGTTAPGTITLDGAGGFDVSGIYQWAIANPDYTIFGPAPTSPVDVAITTTDGMPVIQANTLVMLDEPTIVGQPLLLQATAGKLFSGPVAQFSDAATDPASVAVDSATVVWGDGTTSQGVVNSNDQGTLSVSAQHIYAQPGSYAVNVSLYSPGDAFFQPMASAAPQMIVAPGAPTPVTTSPPTAPSSGGGSGDSSSDGSSPEGSSAGFSASNPALVWRLTPSATYTLTFSSSSPQWLQDQWSLGSAASQSLFDGGS